MTETAPPTAGAGDRADPFESADSPTGEHGTAEVVTDDEVDVDVALLDTIEQELADVEQALARLDQGTYGTCEVCGDAIGDDELSRAPAARFCHQHLPLRHP